MSFSEAALMVGLIVLVFGGGYGLYLKHQIEQDSQELENERKAPPAE